MTTFGSCPTLAVSPQNSTKSDLRRSEIKNFPGGGGHVPQVSHSLACALCALYAISHVHTGTLLFKILDLPLHADIP